MDDKIIATWLVKVTLRAPDDTDDEALAKASSTSVPTNEQLSNIVSEAVVSEIILGGGESLEVHASAERTDK